MHCGLQNIIRVPILFSDYQKYFLLRLQLAKGVIVNVRNHPNNDGPLQMVTEIEYLKDFRSERPGKFVGERRLFLAFLGPNRGV